MTGGDVHGDTCGSVGCTTDYNVGTVGQRCDVVKPICNGGSSRSKGGNLIREKAMTFVVRMYHLNEYLIAKKKFSLADQVFRSGTSIGANLSEAVRAESDSDFVHKYSIAMKEAEETRYWLELAWKVELIDGKLYGSLRTDCDELIKIGTSIMLAMMRKIKAVKSDKA